MQIHGQHALDAGFLQHVRDYLGRNGNPRRTRTAILARIAEVGDRCGDPASRCALERVDHEHEFHQVVVGRRAGGLQHEYVLAAHVFIDLDDDFAIGKFRDDRFAERNAKILTTSSASSGFAFPVKTIRLSSAIGIPGYGR